MSKWEKLIQAILEGDKNLRIEELAKALVKMGYTQNNPGGGSSHYTFRKEGCMPITIPRHTPLKRVYIEMVRDIVAEYLDSEV